MNKKGFTLVELLAVIAILAILVIIALPNVMSLFNEAKSNSFKTELKEIAKTAEQQWMSDSMFETELKTYARVKNSNCTNQLKLSGREEINYYIKLNKSGKIIEYKASDGTYQYSYSGNGLNIEEINNVVQISNINSSDILSVTCAGGSGGSGGSGGGPTNIATCVNEGCNKTVKETELIIAGEPFYVVSSDATNTVLLAKYNLKSDGAGGYAQDTSGTDTNTLKKKFHLYTNYWGHDGLISPYNNEANPIGIRYYSSPYPFVYDENTNEDIRDAVNKYAQKISNFTSVSVTGNLMSYEQAVSLSTAVRNTKNNQYYWLGSAQDHVCIWTVYIGDLNQICNNNQNFQYNRGIRPIITISTSAL